MAMEHQITLLPTRLREFHEKDDLVFQHLLSAKDDIKHKNKSGSSSPDANRRHSFTEDMVDNDKRIYDVVQHIFQKACKIEPQLGQHGQQSSSSKSNHVLETKLIPAIFHHVGQDFNSTELSKWIHANDHKNAGIVDFDGFHRICVHFLKNPSRLEKVNEEDFTLSHLVHHH